MQRRCGAAEEEEERGGDVLASTRCDCVLGLSLSPSGRLSSGWVPSPSTVGKTHASSSQHHGLHAVRNHGGQAAADAGSSGQPARDQDGGGGGRVQHQPHTGLHLLQHQPGPLPAATRPHVRILVGCLFICVKKTDFDSCVVNDPKKII